METLNVFETVENADGCITYYLVNKKGRRVDGAVWDKYPQLQSGVFLTTKTKIFTVLGDEVKSFVADEIYCIINFWIYYKRDRQKYIARLEPLGLKFRYRAETPVSKLGYLSYDGCVFKNGGSWEIYTYSFGVLTIDERIPNVTVTRDKIKDIIKSGFSTDYLMTLTSDPYVMREIRQYDTMDMWKESNDDFTSIVSKLSTLTKEYSAEKIGSVLGLRPYIVSVVTQYLEINNFIGKKDTVY